MKVERRGGFELRADGRRLIGHAAVFNSPADLGGFTEIVMPGAFRRSLSAGADVLALFDHDTRAVLGRTASGTLHLSEDDRGLAFQIDAPNTTVGRDVLEMVGRGDIRGASFAFRAQEDTWRSAGNTILRELHDVDLLDVTVTATPVYADTSVARRSLERHLGTRPDLRSRYVELLRASA